MAIAEEETYDTRALARFRKSLRILAARRYGFYQAECGLIQENRGEQQRPLFLNDV